MDIVSYMWKQETSYMWLIPKNAKKQLTQGERSLSMSNLLLLEDDISLIDGLHYTLKKNGFCIDIARTIEEAEKRLVEIGKYDLLILDVTLPDGTGFEVCEKVRKQNKQIPIIFLTASDEEVNIIRGLDCGGDDYVTKPFKLGELCSLITTCGSIAAGQNKCIGVWGYFD